MERIRRFLVLSLYLHGLRGHYKDSNWIYCMCSW